MRSAHSSSSSTPANFSRSFGKALRILALPVGQVLFLRYLLHSILELRFGFRGITDYDFFLPAPIAFLIFVYVLEEGRPLKLKWQPQFFFSSFSFFLLFIGLNFYFDEIAFTLPSLITPLWFLSLSGMLFCSFFSFVPLKYLLENPNRFAVLPCVLIACSVALHTRFIKAPWWVFAEQLSLSLRPFFQMILGESVVTAITEERVLTIQHPLLLLRIGRGCGGMESFFYFSFLFGLFATLKKSYATQLQWAVSFIFGLVMMYFVNLLRILLLFQIGVWLMSHFGVIAGRELLKFLFHTNLGWILYSISIFSYLSLLNYLFNLVPNLHQSKVFATK